jgi:hypothetical protein
MKAAASCSASAARSGCTRKNHGGFADRVARIDAVPRLRQLPQSVECLGRRRIVKSIVAFEARND